MKNILITGGAGYIGNILVKQLLSLKNYKITVIDNLIHRQHQIFEHCHDDNFKFVYGDVRDERLYKDLVEKNDVIINLAAYVGMPCCNRFPVETKEVNQDSAKYLSTIIGKDQLVIHMNTNSGYGLGQHRDGKAVFCTEETPLNPISLYGITKCAAEKYLLDTGKAISYRLATVFGLSPKQRMDVLVNDFTWKAWNDRYIVLFESAFLRNFVHVRDVSNAIVFALNNSNTMIGNAYNVGNSSANVNKMELCQIIKKYVPDFYITTSEINKDPDQRNYIVSNEKIEKLGWKCNHSLDMGIQELLKSFPIIKNSNYVFSDI